MLRFVDEANASGCEFIVLGVNAVTLEGQRAVPLPIRNHMLHQNQLHTAAVFEPAEARFDILELNAKTKIVDIPVARSCVVGDVNRQMVKQYHARFEAQIILCR